MDFNKDHWYDGWFYDKFIAPNQDRMFGEIKKIIPLNSSVIDVGCGTGRFSFFVADKVKKVVGIDLSKKNIETANNNLLKSPNDRIIFLHSNVSNLILENHHFDYAIITYVIHEVNPDERLSLLKEMMIIADKIIIGDYLVPVNSGFWSLLNKVVEFLAGSEHYNNFKNFIANDGLYGLSKTAEMNIVTEIKNNPQTSQILILEHSNKF
jgi:SAM-dependent methyltransferase